MQPEVIVEIELVPVTLPEGTNVVIGQTHFIKTVEDLYEIVVAGVPQARFAVAFNEASGPRLVRVEGNADDLRDAATRTALAIGAGHVFVLFLRDAYPINLLNAIKQCPEVAQVFCATANPVELLVARTDQGGGVLGVVDGSAPRGVEDEGAKTQRREFLRRIGYKRG